MRVRLTQIDGALPNLALMKLSAWHRQRGDEVLHSRHVEPQPNEPPTDLQYGSSLFSFSHQRVSRFLKAFPNAIVGGTGVDPTAIKTVEQITGPEFSGLDYSGYPDFLQSIGYTQRGCRLKCKFCVVPKKEGKPRSENTIAQIWRGPGFPKQLHLLDNDFFGNPEWRERIAEIRDGKFRVCLSQGINVRLIHEEGAAALATIQYRDTKFARRRLYTAWDNIGDERVFFRGMDTLAAAGIPSKHVMAYMLVGFDPAETWERIWYRFNRMVARGIMPYPMVYNRETRPDLRAFQRWVLTGLYRTVPWPSYTQQGKSSESLKEWSLA